MQRLGALLDARYVAVGAESFRMAPVRLVIMAFLIVIAGMGVGWTWPLGWGALALTSEAVMFPITRRLSRGAFSRSDVWAYFGHSLWGVPVWTSYSLLLWFGPSDACRLAAAIFWCGQLLYVQNFCIRSPLAAAQTAIPSVVAPLLIALLMPRYHGVEQAMVLTMLALCLGHGVNAILDNMKQARALERATDQLIAEKAAAQAAEAEAAAANHAKSAFLATMSHEIRTPLNGVLGMAQAMAAERLPAVQRERLGVIRESGEALHSILNDVLDLAKIEAGRLELEVIGFDLAQVARAAGHAFSANAAARGLSLEVEVEPDLGARLGDPTRVRQVLHNLLSNGLKFTEAGGVRLAVRAEGDGVALSIADTGVGMDEATLARLFQPYAQADTSTTRRFGGTGLGLSICRQLAALMGGEISAQSAPGAGSTFTVRLPLPRSTEAPAEAADAAPSPVPAGLRILVAEDNRTNQLVIQTLLGQAGIDPVIAADGREALEAWRAEDFHLVLMDVQMPEMDGPTAAREIRRLEAETGRARTPILALTANAMTHQIAEYLEAGMDGHVAKPIHVEELFARIEAVLAAAETETPAAASA
ncbi:MAG: ATP-binding protein [Caulobacteraceae bacterium]